MFKKTVITLLAVAIFVIPALAEFEVMHNEYGTVNLYGLAQARHTYVFPPENTLPTSNFDIHRARLGVKGNVFEYGSYNVLYQFNGSTLLDTWGRLDFAPIGIQLGQFKTPFGYEFLQCSGEILTIDRAMCIEGRANLGLLGIAPMIPQYDIGLMLDAHFTFGDYGWVHPAFVGYNGAGINAADTDSDKDLMFGVFANPINMEFFKGFQVFGSYAMIYPNYNEVTAYGGGVALDHPMFTFQGEYITDVFKEVVPGTDLTTMGYYAEGSYRWYTGMDWLHAVEPLVKYDFYDQNTDADYDSFNEITGGVNFHFADLHRFKLQINYVKVDTEVADGFEDPKDDRVSTQLSIMF
jgi:hypothetical protein